MVLLLLLVIKAFALGASGSVSVLASVIETAVELVAVTGAFLIQRWAARRAVAEAVVGRASAAISMLLAGLGLFGAGLSWGVGLIQVLSPQPVGGGQLALVAMGVALLLVIGTVAVRQMAQPRPSILADPAPTFIALLGLVCATQLRAPGLDGAAAMILAVWIGWGAISRIRPALMILLGSAPAQGSLAQPAGVVSKTLPEGVSVPTTDDRS